MANRDYIFTNVNGEELIVENCTNFLKAVNKAKEEGFDFECESESGFNVKSKKSTNAKLPKSKKSSKTKEINFGWNMVIRDLGK